ncbi:MAG: response regulator [Thermodesulfobacteriota bacterium]
MKSLAECTIMVVDDDEVHLDVLARALEDDYQLRIAPDGEAALKAIGPSPPDLILLDIVMPGMDGYEVCRRLKAREETRNIPVVFLTCLTDEQDEAQGLALGAVDYITKPFNPELLKARVRGHLQLKLHRDHLEELADRRARQLIHAERLATLGTLAAGIVHEISSPLAYVLGFADALHADLAKLASRMPPPAEAEPAVLADWRHFLAEDGDMPARIGEGARRILAIMELMRRFACRGQQAKRPVPVAGCIESALALCHNALKYHVTVRKDLAADLPPVMAYAHQLEQVFVNLFKNAADAMSQQQEGVLAIVLRQVDGVLRCTVEDSGPGIPPEDLAAIWEPFFTTKDEDTGTGLGLAISRGIIEDHQGRIWAEDRGEGAGARFVVELPVAPED